MKIISRIIMLTITISLLFIVSNNVFDNASAESYESGVGVSFTLNPSISVTVSGDLAIANLTPGDYKDSNNITVTASSNSIAGYSLSSTVGSSTNTSTELRKDGVDTTNKFSSITTNKASLSNFDDSTNTWGYSYSTDSGSTWISGDITGTTNTGYNGLPLYTSSSSIKLINSTTSGSSSVLFKIGARTTTNQIAGEYTNVINFIGVANPNPAVPTLDQVTNMQDFFSCTLTPEGTTNTLTDTRDGKSYTVTKLKDGNCWMTTNLKLGKGNGEIITLTSADSDVITEFDLKASGTSSKNPDATGDCNVGDWYPNSTAEYLNTTHLCINTTTPRYGVYYNWYTATAGTGTYELSSGDATNSICPKGWRLPPNEGDESYYNLLFTNMGLGNDATSSTIMQGAPTFFLLSGNTYGENLLNQGVYGYYWTRTAGDNTTSRGLVFGSSYVSPSTSHHKGSGHSIRCVKSS